MAKESSMVEKAVKEDDQKETPHPFCSWNARIYVGVICSFLCFLLLVVSAATDHWTVTTVDRNELYRLAGSSNNTELLRNLEKELIYRNCRRGLFSKCYDPVTFNPSQSPLSSSSSSSSAFSSSRIYSAERRCVYEYGYEIARRESTLNYGPDYEVYVHLMRIIFASVIIANVCQLIALAIALFMSMGESKSTAVAGLFAFFATIFSLAIVGLFTVVDDYEKNKIHQASFEAHWVHTHPLLAEHHTTTFGYSFYLAWVAAGLAVVSCISFIVSYCLPICKAKRLLGHGSRSSNTRWTD